MPLTQKNKTSETNLTEQEYIVEVKEFYNRWASFYDGPSMMQVEKDLLLDLCQPNPNQKVLEFGSGTGRITQELLKRGSNVTSVEPSANMRQKLIEKCQNFIDSGKLTVEDATLSTYATPCHSFDLMVLPLVIDHIVDLNDLFAVARDALTPSGRLAISSVNPYYQLMIRKSMVCQGYQRNANVIKTDTVNEIHAYCHLFSSIFQASRTYGFNIQKFVEVVIDDQLIQRFPQLSDQLGYPYIYVMQFDTMADEGNGK